MKGILQSQTLFQNKDKEVALTSFGRIGAIIEKAQNAL